MLCNQWTRLITKDQTQAPWQPLPHFPKQRPGSHTACTAAVTWCHAWQKLGRSAVVQCLLLGKCAQSLHIVIVMVVVST